MRCWYDVTVKGHQSERLGTSVGYNKVFITREAEKYSTSDTVILSGSALGFLVSGAFRGVPQ